MNAAQKRAFTQRWLSNREILFTVGDGEEEPPSRPPVSTVVFKWEMRKARDDDLDGLCNLEDRCFATDRISRKKFRRFIGSPRAAVLVIEADAEIAGAAVVIFKERSAWLCSLAIASGFRGRGWAKRLLSAAEYEARERRCRSMRLEVRADNHAAVLLYRRAGYVDRGRIVSFYEDGTDALYFDRTLSVMSPRNPNYSGSNLILDGRHRVALVPKFGIHFIEDRSLWSMWGHRWNKLTGTWGELQLFHCRRFEMEDEPI